MFARPLYVSAKAGSRVPISDSSFLGDGALQLGLAYIQSKVHVYLPGRIVMLHCKRCISVQFSPNRVFALFWRWANKLLVIRLKMTYYIWIPLRHLIALWVWGVNLLFFLLGSCGSPFIIGSKISRFFLNSFNSVSIQTTPSALLEKKRFCQRVFGTYLDATFSDSSSSESWRTLVFSVLLLCNN